MPHFGLFALHEVLSKISLTNQWSTVGCIVPIGQELKSVSVAWCLVLAGCTISKSNLNKRRHQRGSFPVTFKNFDVKHYLTSSVGILNWAHSKYGLDSSTAQSTAEISPMFGVIGPLHVFKWHWPVTITLIWPSWLSTRKNRASRAGTRVYLKLIFFYCSERGRIGGLTIISHGVLREITGLLWAFRRGSGWCFLSFLFIDATIRAKVDSKC